MGSQGGLNTLMQRSLKAVLRILTKPGERKR
jgi:hypothetical protein